MRHAHENGKFSLIFKNLWAYFEQSVLESLINFWMCTFSAESSRLPDSQDIPRIKEEKWSLPSGSLCGVLIILDSMKTCLLLYICHLKQ